MSTNVVFGFRGGADANQGASLDDMRDLLRGSELASLLMPGTIGNQAAGQGAGIPMTALRRGLLGPLYGAAGTYTIGTASWVEVDPLLGGVLVCTGRPVRIDVSAGVNKGTATGVILSASMDGVEVTGTTDGLCWVYTVGDFFISGWRVLTPRPGPRRFAMVAQNFGAGSSSIYSGPTDVIQMIVTEL